MSQHILALASLHPQLWGFLLPGFSASTLTITHHSQRDPTETCSVPLLPTVWCLPPHSARFPF